MNDRFSIVELPAQAALEVEATVSPLSIPKALGAGYALVTDLVAGAETDLVGAPYARYLDIDWEKARNQGTVAQLFQLLFKKQRMCAGRLVSEPIAGQGEVRSTEIPAGRYVTGIHKGAFHKVGDTYNAMTSWAESQQLQLATHSIESYVSDPGDTAVDDLETRVSIRIMP